MRENVKQRKKKKNDCSPQGEAPKKRAKKERMRIRERMPKKARPGRYEKKPSGQSKESGTKQNSPGEARGKGGYPFYRI